MTPEQKRTHIAELDGWTNVHVFNKWKEGGPMTDGTVIGDRNGFTRLHIPRYLTNRDAIVEAIKRRFVTREQSREFGEAILRLVEPGCCDTRDIAFAVATATAEQLSDAYLQAAK